MVTLWSGTHWTIAQVLLPGSYAFILWRMAPGRVWGWRCTDEVFSLSCNSLMLTFSNPELFCITHDRTAKDKRNHKIQRLWWRYIFLALSLHYRKIMLISIGNFKVPKTLTVKKELRVKFFSRENEIHLHENKKWSSYQWFHSYPRFETEAWCNSEKACCFKGYLEITLVTRVFSYSSLESERCPDNKVVIRLGLGVLSIVRWVCLSPIVKFDTTPRESEVLPQNSRKGALLCCTCGYYMVD